MVKVAVAVGDRAADRSAAERPGARRRSCSRCILAALFQVVVGLTLGFLAQLLFSAVQAAGELIDLASGFTLATLYDPLSNVSSSMFGRIHQLIAVTLLFATNGHLFLLRGFMASYEVFPLHPTSIGTLTHTVLAHVGTFFTSALQIAAPVVVVLFLAELALGLVSRAVPSLNVFAMSFPVKILLTLSLAAVAIGLLPGAVSTIMDRIVEGFGAASHRSGGVSRGRGQVPEDREADTRSGASRRSGTGRCPARPTSPRG